MTEISLIVTLNNIFTSPHLTFFTLDNHSSLGSARPADWLNRAKFNLPSSISRGQRGVLDSEDIAVNSSPQPPGSFPHATRVAAYGKQAAPFSRLSRHARGCWGRILPRRPHGDRWLEGGLQVKICISYIINPFAYLYFCLLCNTVMGIWNKEIDKLQNIFTITLHCYYIWYAIEL